MKPRRARLCFALAVAAACTMTARAQAPAFEVASVKPSNPNPPTPIAAAPMILPALGRLTAQNVTLRMRRDLRRFVPSWLIRSE